MWNSYVVVPSYSTSPNPMDPTTFIDSIDWSLISSYDPDFLYKNRDQRSIQTLTNYFVNIEIGNNKSPVLVHPLSIKLVKLMQISLINSNNSLSEVTEKLKNTETKLQNKNKEISQMSKAFEKAQSILKKKVIGWEKCPVCKKKFRSIDYLDAHFESKHRDILQHWRYIRQKPITTNIDNNDYNDLLKRVIDLEKRRNDTGKRTNSIDKSITKSDKEEKRRNLHEELSQAVNSLESSINLWEEQKKDKLNKLNPFHPSRIGVKNHSINNLKLSTQATSVNIEDSQVNHGRLEIELNRSSNIDKSEKKRLKRTIAGVFEQPEKSNEFSQSEFDIKSDVAFIPEEEKIIYNSTKLKESKDENIKIDDSASIQKRRRKSSNRIREVVDDKRENVEIKANTKKDKTSNQVENEPPGSQIKQVSEQNQPMVNQTSHEDKVGGVNVKNDDIELIFSNARRFLSENKPKHIDESLLREVSLAITKKVSEAMKNLSSNHIKQNNLDPDYETYRKDIEKKLNIECPMNLESIHVKNQRRTSNIFEISKKVENIEKETKFVEKSRESNTHSEKEKTKIIIESNTHSEKEKSEGIIESNTHSEKEKSKGNNETNTQNEKEKSKGTIETNTHSEKEKTKSIVEFNQLASKRESNLKNSTPSHQSEYYTYYSDDDDQSNVKNNIHYLNASPIRPSGHVESHSKISEIMKKVEIEPNESADVHINANISNYTNISSANDSKSKHSIPQEGNKSNNISKVPSVKESKEPSANLQEDTKSNKASDIVSNSLDQETKVETPTCIQINISSNNNDFTPTSPNSKIVVTPSPTQEGNSKLAEDVTKDTSNKSSHSASDTQEPQNDCVFQTPATPKTMQKEDIDALEVVHNSEIKSVDKSDDIVVQDDPENLPSDDDSQSTPNSLILMDFIHNDADMAEKIPETKQDHSTDSKRVSSKKSTEHGSKNVIPDFEDVAKHGDDPPHESSDKKQANIADNQNDSEFFNSSFDKVQKDEQKINMSFKENSKSNNLSNKGSKISFKEDFLSKAHSRCPSEVMSVKEDSFLSGIISKEDLAAIEDISILSKSKQGVDDDIVLTKDEYIDFEDVADPLTSVKKAIDTVTKSKQEHTVPSASRSAEPSKKAQHQIKSDDSKDEASSKAPKKIRPFKATKQRAKKKSLDIINWDD